MSELVIHWVVVLFGGFLVTMVWKFSGLLLDGMDASQSRQRESARKLVLEVAVALVLVLLAGILHTQLSLDWPRWVPTVFPPVAVVLLGMGGWHWRKHRQQPSRRSLIFIILAALTVLLPVCLFVLMMVALAAIKACGL